MRTLRLALLFALALPAAARAGEATIVSRDVPLGQARVLAASGAPHRFDLVGLHWRGPGSVSFRTRSVGGRWSAWVDAAPEDEDLPDAGDAERARAGSWRLGNPWWVGPSDRIEYRLRGQVVRLRAFFVRSPDAPAPVRALQSAGSPAIVPRSGWNADESIRRAPPSFAPSIRFAVVHHTAGANGYTAGQAPAIVRAIELYHVKGNGWNDIGYNFLVDRFGKIYEGRYGGVERNVVGAHAEGFNTGSVGVAVIGEYSSLAVAAAARDALARLLAWRLDVAHVDPLSTLSFPSGGNARFRAGVPVFLRAVSGHRDTGFTDCPGTALYNLLNGIAGEVSSIGLPKLYDPLVAGSVPGLVRFRARFSAPSSWTVDVKDPTGLATASTSGFGAELDWTWDANGLPAGTYTYAIRAGAETLPATGAVGGSGTDGPLAITGVAADPETISPNDDGAADASTVTYTLSVPANVTVSVRDAVGATVATLSRAWRRAGEHALSFTAAGLPDGIYAVALDAAATGGRTASAEVQVAVTRTLGEFRAGRVAFSPNGDGRADRIAFRFVLAGEADVRLRVLRRGKWVATPFAGPLGPGPHTVDWDGAKRVGRLLDGDYDAVVEATDLVATSTLGLPFASDTHAPRIRILERFPLRVWVSEPARLTLRVGGRSLVQDAAVAGPVRIAKAGRRGGVRVVAWDAAGNTSIPATKR